MPKRDIHDSLPWPMEKVGGNDLVVVCMDFEFIGAALAASWVKRYAGLATTALNIVIPFIINKKWRGQG